MSAETVFFGPGFVDASTLRRGLVAFVESRDDFDFYVVNLLGAGFDNIDLQYFHRYGCPSYPVDLLRNFAADAGRFLQATKVPKIVILIGQDSYALSEQKANWMASLDGYMIAWAGGFSRPLDQLEVLTKEDFYRRKAGPDLSRPKAVFGRWHEVVSQHEHRFINLGHFLAETEFNWTALDGRRDGVIVPGQMYVRREAARQTLAASKLLTRSGRFKFLMSVLDHSGFKPYSRPLLHSIYNKTFTNAIGSVRYAYTDGYGYDRPARKFFEIPGLGTVMLCTPCAGFSDLGFDDRKHAMIVAPEDVLDAVQWLEGNPEAAQEIASAGRKLIWDKHSLRARAEQLSRCLTSIKAGRYAGSRWQGGEFVVTEKSDHAEASAVNQ